MKTIFKKNQEVYDQFNFPDTKGKIVEIQNNVDSKYIVKVHFDREDRKYVGFYSLKGIKSGSTIPTLSTKPYEVVFKGFEQKKSSPNFYDVYDRKSSVFVASDYDENYPGYPKQDLANAAEALRRLLFLRDYYNEGWEPDWKDNFCKYTIECYESELYTDDSYNFDKVMSFKTEELRDKFLEEQKELLEIAKPLL